MMGTILWAVGLVLVVEGLTYALVPSQLKRMMAGIMDMTNEQLRMAGTLALAAGVLVVWLATRIII
jgi:uncharacterized protein